MNTTTTEMITPNLAQVRNAEGKIVEVYQVDNNGNRVESFFL